MNPLATSQALYLTISQFVFILIRNNHLQPIRILPTGSGRMDLVLFTEKTDVSSWKIIVQRGERASWIELGSTSCKSSGDVV